MSLELVSKCNLYKIDSAVVVVVANHKPSVCLVYMYIKNKNMVCGVLCICHVLILDQNTYDNAHSYLWHYVVLCVDHNITKFETGFYYKTF